MYPLDEKIRWKDGLRHFKKGEIVGVDRAKSHPYTVHFVRLGGTNPYHGRDLARLPPDPIAIGVVRVWNEQATAAAGAAAQEMTTPQARKSDRLVVELRNFDGWLCRALDLGYFREDAAAKAGPGLLKLIDHKQFWAAVRTAGWLRTQRETDLKSLSTALISELRKRAVKDTKFEAVLINGTLDEAAKS